MGYMKKKLTFHILTLFPGMFEGPLSESILKRGKEKDLLDFKIYNLRDSGIGPRKQVDDSPYGGGPGMVLKVDVMDKAIHDILNKVSKGAKTRILLMTPQGKKLDQKAVRQ